MSDNTRSNKPVSRNCGTCRWRAIDGYCDYEIPPELPEWLDRLWHSESKRVTKTDGTDCPCWQAKEAAAKAERGVTCIGCELADDCPGFTDCPKLAAAKVEGCER